MTTPVKEIEARIAAATSVAELEPLSILVVREHNASETWSIFLHQRLIERAYVLGGAKMAGLL